MAADDMLPLTLLRTAARTFYTAEHILVVDALAIHSTLSDQDLAHVLSMQTKALRKLCGKLREDGLVSVQTRGEKRADGAGAFFGAGGGSGSAPARHERLQFRDWYYLNFHRAIDSLKYRLWRLTRHIEALGAPTAAKKDLACPRCKSSYTELEVMDNISPATGLFLCHRCGHELQDVDEAATAGDDEGMQRLNSQLGALVALMRAVDATSVAENDFDAALAKQRPVQRDVADPGARVEAVDLPRGAGGANLQASKGLALAPERISVRVQDEAAVRREGSERARREREARQNALPEWMTRSTVTGDVTALGAREEAARRERGALMGAAGAGEEEEEGKNGAARGGEDESLALYFEELRGAQEAEARAAKRAEEEEEAEDEDDEDDDEDDEAFEDVDVGASVARTPAAGHTVNGNGTKHTNGVVPPSTAGSTPAANVESSAATDDDNEPAERAPKRVRISEPETSSAPDEGSRTNGLLALGKPARVEAQGTPAASDEDEDDLEFENV